MKYHLEVKQIRSLLAALGFPRDLVQKKIPEKIQKDSIQVQDLVDACNSQLFEVDLHFTINNKTGNYNSKVLHKSLLLLASKSCKIPEIRDARMSFEIYERFDQRGIPLCIQTLLRCLRVVGKYIAPEKLTEKIRHVKMAFREKGRIQLDEFLDFIPLCSEKALIRSDDVTHIVDRDSSGVYQLDEFVKMMTPNDERFYSELNLEYREEKLKFQPPKFIFNPFESDLLISVQDQVMKKPDKCDLQQSSDAIRISKNGKKFDLKIERKKKKENSPKIKVEEVEDERKDLKKNVQKINSLKDEDIKRKIEDLNFIIFTKKSWGKTQFFGHLDNKTLEASNNNQKEKSPSVSIETSRGYHGDDDLIRKNAILQDEDEDHEDKNHEDEDLEDEDLEIIRRMKEIYKKNYEKKPPEKKIKESAMKSSRRAVRIMKDKSTQSTDPTDFDDYIACHLKLEDLAGISVVRNELEVTDAERKARRRCCRLAEKLVDSDRMYLKSNEFAEIEM